MDKNMLLYFLGFLVLIWFLMIAPQRKKEKERQRLLDNLEVNDQIVTLGGIYGYIEEIGKETLLLEIADGVVIEVLKNAVAMVKNDEVGESKELIGLKDKSEEGSDNEE